MLLLVIMYSLVSPNFKFVFNLQGIVDALLADVLLAVLNHGQSCTCCAAVCSLKHGMHFDMCVSTWYTHSKVKRLKYFACYGYSQVMHDLWYAGHWKQKCARAAS